MSTSHNPSKILWIDNDKTFLKDYIFLLEKEGYEINQVFTLREGVRELEKNDYDLLILDVMMAVTKEEEAIFPPKETNRGRESGLVFYEKYKSIAQKKKITIFIFTIREELDIHEKFLAKGLPPQNYMTKLEGSNMAIFLKRIKKILKQD